MTDKKWVIMELSYQGEQKTPEELALLLRGQLGGGADIFIPAVTFSRRNSTVTICLMEGYFFIEASLPTSTYFDLEDTTYVRKVLTRDESKGRFLYYVDQAMIDDLKSRLKEQTVRNIQVGDMVKVVEGPYSKLSGEILSLVEGEDRALIHIVDLKSMEVIVELPFQFFEHMGDDWDEPDN